MKTFVAENVLTDCTDGLVVIKAKNLASAIDLIKKDNSTVGLYHADEIIEKLRELKGDEIVYVYGGG